MPSGKPKESVGAQYGSKEKSLKALDERKTSPIGRRHLKTEKYKSMLGGEHKGA